VVTAAFAARDSVQSASDKAENKNGALNPRHFFVQNSHEKGFFYSFNEKGLGARLSSGSGLDAQHDRL